MVNLAAAYIKPRLDSTLESLSSRRKTRGDAARALRAARVSWLAGEPHQQLLIALHDLRLRSLSIMAFVGAGLAQATALAFRTGDGVERWLGASLVLIAATGYVLGIMILRDARNAMSLLQDVISEAARREGRSNSPLQQPAPGVARG